MRISGSPSRASALALLLGEWQMFMRSPLHAWIGDPELYYRSVTAHGTTMAYVLPTLVAMGFGYFVTEAALKRPLIGLRWAWVGLRAGGCRHGHGDRAGRAGAGLGAVHVLSADDRQSVLLHRRRAGGRRLVDLGRADVGQSLHAWKRDNPGAPVPFAMFATVAGSYLWGWTAVGAALELLFQIIPVALGLTQHDRCRAGARVLLLDAARHRLFLADADLHRLLHDRSARDRRPAVQRPDGADLLHPVPRRRDADRRASPVRGSGGRSGFKFLHSVFTALVALPTLLTVFTICASVEIAGRLRGGKGVLGWLTVLPWRNPIMLGAAFSFVMLGFGGAGGLINMSYQLDSTIHNTQWVTGHFHLIFGGAIVIMYFVIAYDVWPHLTGRALDSFGLMRAQLWTWFVGMIVLTFPWHYVGILGMPRRMAFYDYTDPAIARTGRLGDDVGHRRRDPGGIRRAVPDRAGARADGGPRPSLACTGSASPRIRRARCRRR